MSGFGAKGCKQCVNSAGVGLYKRRDARVSTLSILVIAISAMRLNRLEQLLERVVKAQSFGRLRKCTSSQFYFCLI